MLYCFELSSSACRRSVISRTTDGLFDGGADDQPVQTAPAHGFFKSLLVDVSATLARLESLGLDRDRKEDVPGKGEGATIALVRDPDGTLVELIPIDN